MANTGRGASDGGSPSRENRRYLPLVLLVIAAAVYLACSISPPHLMDDVDAVQAQIARNMLQSGDWVTARLDGVIYLEKSPLIYWMMAVLYKVIGPFDWVARLPVALSAIGLALLTQAFGRWAFGKRAGFYAGLIIATCVGLFLFTRIQIPDVMLTFTITLALWGVMRALEPDEPRPRLWAYTVGASLGVGLLLKSLVALVFPIGAGVVYLYLTGQLFQRRAWQRLHPFASALIALVIAAPWHILATLRNPPYFVFTLKSLPGQYHGFFWFYFINEQLLRFLNMRYPRDYNTVPRLYFWAFHLLWLFPWSVYLPAIFKLKYRGEDRASRTRLMALCTIGVVLVFFTFSTTQEYYSMPTYPAFALLLGCAMTMDNAWIRGGSRFLAILTATAATIVFTLAFLVWNQPTPGDISDALSRHPKVYTLSLGHMEDLTLSSFAYLRTPLLLAGVAFLIGTLGVILLRRYWRYMAIAVMMIVFFQAARLALVVFDPYMSSAPLAQALMKSPEGQLIVDHHYYDFSSVFFYTNRRALLLNGIINNLVYGSAAPGCPPVFINDAQFAKIWETPQRWYIVAADKMWPRFEKLVGPSDMVVIKRSGGKFLMTNHPLTQSPGSKPLPRP